MTIAWHLTDDEALLLECEEDAGEREPVIIGLCCICDGEVREEDAVTCGRNDRLAHEECAKEKYGD